jgi:hypothetical protein
MCNNNRYIIVTLLSIISLSFLIFENCKVGKVVREKENKLMQIEAMAKNKSTLTPKFGYSDIINVFDNQEGIRIIKLIEQKEEKRASAEIEILGDMSTAEKVLKNVEKKENFQNIQNMKMEKREDNNIITTLNMNFIKNK